METIRLKWTFLSIRTRDTILNIVVILRDSTIRQYYMILSYMYSAAIIRLRMVIIKYYMFICKTALD